MILVGMGIHNVREFLHLLRLEIGYHQLGIGHIAAIDDHGFVAAGEKDAVGLAYVEKVYLERSRRCLGGFAGDQAAPS